MAEREETMKDFAIMSNKIQFTNAIYQQISNVFDNVPNTDCLIRKYILVQAIDNYSADSYTNDAFINALPSSMLASS